MRGSRSRGTRGRVVLVAIGVALTACVGVATLPTPAHAAPTSGWRPPVGGPVVRAFAAPAGTYGPGHRGVDFAADSGTQVVAAGRGTVVFAGEVAGGRHVVVLHRGGVRTSYSFLRDELVAEGDAVEPDTVLGHSGGPDPDGAHTGVVHFGVRVGDRYVDPMLLFASGDLGDRVRLVPVPGGDADGGSWSRARVDESSGLLDGLAPPAPPGGLGASDGDRGCGGSIPVIGGVVDAVCGGIDWAAARTGRALRTGLALLAGAGDAGRVLAARLRPDLERLLAVLARSADAVVQRYVDQPVLRVLADVVEIGARFLDWTDRECDGGAPAADGTGGSGHLVMAVAGIDSQASARARRSFGLDVDALGYRRDEVHWYSYAPDGGAYGADDTHGDIRVAAKRLAAQLRALDAAEPGREVDLIAHSQGGVVVERFLRFEYDASDPTFPPIGTVVTLSSPHRGAPLATTADDLRRNGTTRRALDLLDPVLPGPPSGATSVRQLAEDSPFMERLGDVPLPEHVDLTTIGGTDDVIVPANRIRVPGATEVVVDVAGLADHTAIHHDGRALQVVRAALEQRPPPCTSLLEGLRAAIEPVLISRVEGDLGEYLTTYLERGR